MWCEEDDVRTMALLIGVAFVGLGIAGLVAPNVLGALGEHATTPVGLWVVALTRLGIGTVLYVAARAARHPSALHLLGALFIVSGVITPFFGTHARVIAEALLSGGPGRLRLWSLAIAALGAFIAYTVSDNRRAAYRPLRTLP